MENEEGVYRILRCRLRKGEVFPTAYLILDPWLYLKTVEGEVVDAKYIISKTDTGHTATNMQEAIRTIKLLEVSR